MAPVLLYQSPRLGQPDVPSLVESLAGNLSDEDWYQRFALPFHHFGAGAENHVLLGYFSQFSQHGPLVICLSQNSIAATTVIRSQSVLQDLYRCSGQTGNSPPLSGHDCTAWTVCCDSDKSLCRLIAAIVEPLLAFKLPLYHASIHSILTSAAAKGCWGTQPRELLEATATCADGHVVVQMYEAFDGHMGHLFTHEEAWPYVTVSNLAAGALRTLDNLTYLHTPAARGHQLGSPIVHGDYKTANTLFLALRCEDCHMVWPFLADLTQASQVNTRISRAQGTPHYSCKRLLFLDTSGQLERQPDGLLVAPEGYEGLPLHWQLVEQVAAWGEESMPPFMLYSTSHTFDDVFAWAVATADELRWTNDHHSKDIGNCQATGSSSTSSGGSSTRAWDREMFETTQELRDHLYSSLVQLQVSCMREQLCRAWVKAAEYAAERGYAPLRAPYDPAKCAAGASQPAAAAAAAASAGGASNPAASGQEQQVMQGIVTTTGAPAAAANNVAGPQHGGSSGSMQPPHREYTLQEAVAALDSARAQVLSDVNYVKGCMWELLSAIPCPRKQEAYMDMAAGRLVAGELVTARTQHSKAPSDVCRQLQHLQLLMQLVPQFSMQPCTQTRVWTSRMCPAVHATVAACTSLLQSVFMRCILSKLPCTACRGGADALWAGAGPGPDPHGQAWCACSTPGFAIWLECSSSSSSRFQHP